jgi:hypothetical protein
MLRAFGWNAPFVLVVLGLASACGSKPAEVPVLGSKTAPSGSASAAEPPPSPLPSGLPAALPVPPMGVRGSTRAKVKDDASGACTERTADSATGPKPEDSLKKLVSTCKLNTASAVFSAALSDGEGHREWPFRAKAGHCYRVLSSSDGQARDVVVVFRDGKGDVVTTGPESALPTHGKACFDADDDTTLLVSVGTGKGSVALQIVEP